MKKILKQQKTLSIFIMMMLTIFSVAVLGFCALGGIRGGTFCLGGLKGD